MRDLSNLNDIDFVLYKAICLQDVIYETIHIMASRKIILCAYT